MHLGKSYKLAEFLIWTRWKVYGSSLSGPSRSSCTFFSVRWLSIPLTIVALLGTATSFIVGFKNVQTYNRAADALDIWIGILSKSRRWGRSCRTSSATKRSREPSSIATLRGSPLRYDLRRPRVWESTNKRYNAEYRRFYRVPEWNRTSGNCSRRTCHRPKRHRRARPRRSRRSY